jgi:hypothetical protein
MFIYYHFLLVLLSLIARKRSYSLNTIAKELSCSATQCIYIYIYNILYIIYCMYKRFDKLKAKLELTDGSLLVALARNAILSS